MLEASVAATRAVSTEAASRRPSDLRLRCTTTPLSPSAAVAANRLQSPMITMAAVSFSADSTRAMTSVAPV
jgi:hypothetical protein